MATEGVTVEMEVTEDMDMVQEEAEWDTPQAMTNLAVVAVEVEAFLTQKSQEMDLMHLDKAEQVPPEQ